MLVSILHRATGDGLAVVGAMGLVWWLYAAASGPADYAVFMGVASSWFGKLLLIGVSWAFFQHMLSGLRHLVLDTGAGYELKTNKSYAIGTIIGSVVLTAALWTWLLVGAN
jgi:succinate dehydrogenase / fumarate reductase, cytochrome b subunit